METKVTMSEDRRKAIAIHVDQIMKHRNGLFDDPKSIDIRKQFSDYVINSLINGPRGVAKSFKGTPEQLKALSDELYLQYMQVWEEKYGPNKKN